MNRRLVEQCGEKLAPPGGSQLFRSIEANGSEMTMIARGDSFDCYQGRREFTAFALSPRTVLKLAWFILWTWWAKGTWFGMKTRLWYWSLTVIQRELLNKPTEVPSIPKAITESLKKAS